MILWIHIVHHIHIYEIKTNQSIVWKAEISYRDRKFDESHKISPRELTWFQAMQAKPHSHQPHSHHEGMCRGRLDSRVVARSAADGSAVTETASRRAIHMLKLVSGERWAFPHWHVMTSILQSCNISLCTIRSHFHAHAKRSTCVSGSTVCSGDHHCLHTCCAWAFTLCQSIDKRQVFNYTGHEQKWVHHLFFMQLLVTQSNQFPIATMIPAWGWWLLSWWSNCLYHSTETGRPAKL